MQALIHPLPFSILHHLLHKNQLARDNCLLNLSSRPWSQPVLIWRVRYTEGQSYLLFLRRVWEDSVGGGSCSYKFCCDCQRSWLFCFRKEDVLLSGAHAFVVRTLVGVPVTVKERRWKKELYKSQQHWRHSVIPNTCGWFELSPLGAKSLQASYCRGPSIEDDQTCCPSKRLEKFPEKSRSWWCLGWALLMMDSTPHRGAGGHMIKLIKSWPTVTLKHGGWSQSIYKI